MRLSRPRLLLALLSLALVLVIVLRDLERTSPGPLAAVHEAVPELRGGAGCARCHHARGLAAGCVGCHAEIGQQLASGRGLHGGLSEAQRAACGSCHDDHHGAEHELAGERAFALAGFEPRARFEHRGLALAVLGRHAELGCADCHPRADAALLRAGEKRFLGLDAGCQSCHEDPHQGRMARACADCHAESRAFGELGSFAHTPDFPLRGAHAIADCRSCHPRDGPWSVEAVGSRSPPPARTCADCHPSPHAQRFVEGAAAMLGKAAGASCAECHPSEPGGFRAALRASSAALHAASGFALAPPHERADCSACHPAGPEFAARHPGRGADDCAACHADPHGAQFLEPRERALRCIDCHEPQAFEPPRFDLAMHARTGFALEQSHARVACHACHLVDERIAHGGRVFRGLSGACASCHADAHPEGFVARAADPSVASARDCARCHLPSSFADVPEGGFDHGRDAGFALEGAHARARCEACHARSDAPDALGRRFGRVSVLFGEPARACFTCHADAHAGRFDRPGLPLVVAGAEGCARCHSTERFDHGARAGFDHALWTGHALDGAHAFAACELCHAPRAEPDALGRRFGRVEEVFGGPVEQCSSCHPDPHGARFDAPGLPALVDGRASCARCHDTLSFRTGHERFEHARWTGFALDGAHAALACVACHPAPADARERRFGPAAGQDCAACHADPHAGQFAVRGATDCARCHASTTSFATLAFDHARDARFALDAQHAKLDCAACHKAWPLPGGGSAVRYKPLGTECSDCHASGRGR